MGEKYFETWSFFIAILFSTGLLAIYLQHKVKGVARGISKLPPGRRGWPLIGDSFVWYSAVASSHPPRFVEDQVKRFGRIFSCNVFGRLAVVSADPTFNRFIMQNEGKLFQSSYIKSFRDLVGKNGVINMHGEQQRKLHAMAVNMMRFERLKFHFLKDIQVVMLQTLNLHDGQVILLEDTCRKVAIHLMVKQLLGVSNESEINEMAQLFSDFADGCLSVPIKLPGFAYCKAMQAREIIINKINRTIEQTRQQPRSEVGNGMLGKLVEEESLPDDAIADFIINLLFAGNETTAKTMLFAIYYLTQSPMALKQLMEEQDSLQGTFNEDMLTWEDYKNMPFTKCVIDETLRLGGIAIWLMREAKEEIAYQDYIIPKGCFVVPFLSAVHLDESFYKDALRFDPWRWLDPENQEKRNWRTSSFYAPFGGGARLCSGAELAHLQIALFLHYFVTRYRWRQLKEDRMSFFPSARLVNGFQICINRRIDEETVEVHRSLADKAFRQEAEVILADGQLTKARVEQLNEVQKLVGLPAEYAQKVIKSITTTKMAAAIETAISQGRLNKKQIRELKEANVQLDSMISESLREDLFKKTVDEIFSSGIVEFEEEELYEKIPSDLSINAEKAKGVVHELSRTRLSKSLIQSVALLRKRNHKGAVSSLNDKLACNKAVPAEPLSWEVPEELTDLFTIYLKSDTEPEKLSRLQYLLGISNSTAAALQ